MEFTSEFDLRYWINSGKSKNVVKTPSRGRHIQINPTDRIHPLVEMLSKKHELGVPKPTIF